jgi:hypothetical protein
MKRHAIGLFVAAMVLSAVTLSAADLTIDYQMNTVAQDYANNYLTFQGKAVSVAKDQFAPGADAVSGASKLESTAMFNIYRFDIFGGKLLPGGLRSLFLYPVADDGTRTGDGLTAIKNADGSLMIRFIHRGTAYQLTTDKTGKLTLPGAVVKTRRIGHTDNLISTDFSRSGKVADVDWRKVWNSSIADGKSIGGTTSKTGKITDDVATSTVYVWSGDLQLAFDGKILKINGALNAALPKK